MKKIISVFLAFALIISLISVFSGCIINITPKTPSERFNDALDAVGKELKVGPISEQFKVEDANVIDSSIALSAPKLLGEDTVSVRVSGTGDRETNSLSAKLTAMYKASEITAKLDLLDGKDAYVSFPETTEYYLHASFDSLKEEFGDALGKFESLGDVIGVGDKFREKIDGLRAEYTKDDRVTVESAEIEIFGEKVKAEKLSVRFDHDDTAAIAKELTDFIREYEIGDDYSFEIDDAIDNEVEATVSLYTSGGRTVRAEATVDSEDGNAAAKYDFAETEKGVRAELTVSSGEDGENKTSTPFSYEHTKDGDDYEGKITLDLRDEVKADEFSSATISFYGKESVGSADFTYNIAIGAGGQAVTFPLRVTARTLGKDNVEFFCKLEASIVGATLSATTVVAKGTLERDSFEPDHAIEIGKDMSDGDQEKIRKIGLDLLKKAGDFVNILGPALSGGFDLDDVIGGIDG